MDLSKLANKNTNLKDLYEEVNQWKPVKAVRGQSIEWGSYVDNNTAYIEFSPDDKSPSALAHELLHFKVQKSGYKRLRVIATNAKNKQGMKLLMEALDNELQHHKMYKSFVEMGFSKQSFYSPNDVETKDYIGERLTSGSNELIDLIPLYFTIVAPGGHLTANERDGFKKQIRVNYGSSSEFDLIDNELDKWVSSSSFNQESIVKAIFSLVNGSLNTWIGYDDGTGFPTSGFFVGNPCSISDFQ
ncbi:TPA: hypothetical protein NJ512_001432 [Vibrio parahaemolyticus]|nr:hypothetical protein [Vibrio parahaemolyticus]MBE4496918.1 hypothetical protein [Vibrio parahaemolyticus]HCG8040216.1 hypothetical protein [Vibrio parahaemolyticus]